MARAYTHRFVLALGDGVVTRYTVPAGQRAVIRALAACSETGEAGTVWGYANGHMFYRRAIQANSDSVLWTGHLALYAGEELAVYTAGPSTKVFVTGYLFDAAGERSAPGRVVVVGDDALEQLPATA